MLEVSRLRQHRRIPRIPRRRQKNNDKRIVSHCTDITETLSEENSDTEENSWDESVADDSTDSVHSHSSAASALQLPVASASTSSSDNVCDICWLNPRAKIVLCLVATHVSAIRVHVKCLLLPINESSVDNRLTCYCSRLLLIDTNLF